MSLACANEELVFVAQDVADGECEVLGEAQTAAVDEFERDAGAARADME